MAVVLFGLTLVAALAASGAWARIVLRRRSLAVPNAGADAAVATDRTRWLEAALIEAQGTARLLADADRVKSDVLAALTERLRAPLNTIHGFAELVRLRADEDPAGESLTRRQGQAMGHILAAADELLALADAAGDLSRAEAGRLELEIERLDPQVLLRQAWEGLADRALAARVGLQTATPAAGVAVMADRLRLAQVLTTLMSNAIRYNHPGGLVLAEVRQGAGGVTVAIHDTGRGMAEDELRSLFAPAFGAGQVQGRAQGLGLATAQRLVRAMGGRLEAASQEGEGSTFTLTLPAAPGVAEVRAPLTDVRLGRAVILCVDGDPACAALMRHMAQTLGAGDLHAAPNGREGAALARALKPDLIVTALDLPDMDGFALKAALDADPLTRGVPVIALSARGGPAERRRAREAGFRDHLTKPFDIRVLALALQAALKGPEPAGGPDTAAA